MAGKFIESLKIIISHKSQVINHYNPFATITSLTELYFRFTRFILLVQTQKVISMKYGSSISNLKP